MSQTAPGTVGPGYNAGVSGGGAPFGGAGSVPSMRFVSGQWYGAAGTVSGGNTRPNGFTTLIPFRADTPVTLQAMAVDVTTAGQAGALIRLGIYADSGGQPGPLVLDAGTVAGDSAALQTVPVAVTLTAGWYWLAATSQNAPTTQPACMGWGTTATLAGGPLYAAHGTVGAAWGTAAVGNGAYPASMAGAGLSMTNVALNVLVQAK